MRLLFKILLLVIFALVSLSELRNSPDYTNYTLHITSEYLNSFGVFEYGYFILLTLLSASHFDVVLLLWLLNWVTLALVLCRGKFSIYFILCYGLMFGWIWHTVQLRQGAIMFMILLLLTQERRSTFLRSIGLAFGLFWHKSVLLFSLQARMRSAYIFILFLLLQLFLGIRHPLNTINMFTSVVCLALVLSLKFKKKLNIALLVLFLGYFIGGLYNTILASRCLELSLLVVLLEISQSRYKYLMFFPFMLVGLFFRYG